MFTEMFETVFKKSFHLGELKRVKYVPAFQSIPCTQSSCYCFYLVTKAQQNSEAFYLQIAYLIFIGVVAYSAKSTHYHHFMYLLRDSIDTTGLTGLKMWDIKWQQIEKKIS